MHSRQGKSQGRGTLRRRRGYHAHSVGWASNPPTNAPTALPFDNDHDLLRAIGTAWRTILSAADRAAWAATAAANQITLNDGTTKFVTAQRFYSWFYATNYTAYIEPPYRTNLDPTFIGHPPPAIYAPPAAPSAPTAFASLGAFTWILSLNTTPGQTLSGGTLLAPNWRSRTPAALTVPKVRCYCALWTAPNPAGNYQIIVFFQGLVPSDAWLSGKLFTTRANANTIDPIPSPPTTFTWP